MQEMVNWHATRRHYVGKELDPKRSMNHYVSLCGKCYGTSFEKHAQRQKTWTKKEVDYAALTMCKLCERIAARADA